MKKIYFAIILVFLIIFIQIIYINLYNKNYYTKQYNELINNYVYGESALRGRIMDINGEVLVDNEEIYVINYIKNSKISQEEEYEIAKKIVEILSYNELASEDEVKKFHLMFNDEDELINEDEKKLLSERKITSDDIYQKKLQRVDITNYSDESKYAIKIFTLMNTGISYEKKQLVTDIEYEDFAKIVEENLPGILAENSIRRIYPYEDTLKSIFGNVGKIYSENVDDYLDNGYLMSDIVGISYLEAQYEEILCGEKAIYKVSENGTLVLIKEEIRGADVILSIDIKVQLELEKLMKEQMENSKKFPNTQYFSDAYAIVGNPNTGEIIAISGLRMMEVNNKYEFKDITSSAISSSFTTGSIVKAASSTVGYINNAIDIDANITDSCVKLYLVPEKCSWKDLGVINDIEAIKYSSNYYQYILAINLAGYKYSYNLKMDITEKNFEKYRNIFNKYGLGVKTQIDLPGETTGIMGSVIAPDLYLNYAIGQYDTYTPVQMLTYVNTLANDLNRTGLSLVNRAVNHNDEIVYMYKPEILSNINLDQVYYSRILDGLNSVVTGGTGYGYIDSKYNPAGKTGTSETFLDIDADGILETKTYTRSFIGFAPVENPEYTVALITPHISYQSDEDEEDTYIYNMNRAISLGITNFLFENR